jgi:hypothetical protein
MCWLCSDILFPDIETPCSTYCKLKQVAAQRWNIWHSKTYGILVGMSTCDVNIHF